jgi:phosphoribosylformylglycinamidine synthase PurS subunit
MKLNVTIMLRKGILDPQGKAIGQAISSMGVTGVGTVRMGKVIELELPDNTADADIKRICDDLLHNPVMEDYTIERLEA